MHHFRVCRWSASHHGVRPPAHTQPRATQVRYQMRPSKTSKEVRLRHALVLGSAGDAMPCARGTERDTTHMLSRTHTQHVYAAKQYVENVAEVGVRVCKNACTPNLHRLEPSSELKGYMRGCHLVVVRQRLRLGTLIVASGALASAR